MIRREYMYEPKEKLSVTYLKKEENDKPVYSVFFERPSKTNEFRTSFDAIECVMPEFAWTTYEGHFDPEDRKRLCDFMKRNGDLIKEFADEDAEEED